MKGKIILTLLLASPLVAETSKMCKVHPEYCEQQVKEMSFADQQALAYSHRKTEDTKKAAAAAEKAETDLFNRLLADHGLDKFPIASSSGNAFYNGMMDYPCGGVISIAQDKYLVYTPYPSNYGCPGPDKKKR